MKEKPSKAMKICLCISQGINSKRFKKVTEVLGRDLGKTEGVVELLTPNSP